MEKKTIYIVKYSTDQYDNYREHIHSAYDNHEDADIAKLDVLINILTTIREWQKIKEQDYSDFVNEKFTEDCLSFIIDRNNVWVEELNYFTKK